MENANRASEIVISGLPITGIRANTSKVSTESPADTADATSGLAKTELTRVSPVIRQMTTVSQKVPVMEIRDCLTGFFVFAAAATRGAGTETRFI